MCVFGELFKLARVNIHYFLSDVNGNVATIHVRCFVGERFVASTKQRIPIKYWDKKKETVTSSSAELVRLRKKLEILQADLETFMMEPRTKQQFKDRVQRVMNAKGEGFYAAYDEFYEHKKKTLGGERQASKYSILKTHLQSFEEKENEALTFQGIDADFAGRFYAYFNEEDLSPNYAGRLVKCLVEFMRWTHRKNIHFESSWEDIKGRAVKVAVTICNGSDIIAFLRAPLVGIMADVRDIFLVGCYSSLRYSDLQAIEPGNRHGNSIYKSTQKDQDEVIIPLPKACIEILDRHNWRLPQMTLKHFNEYIKLAADKAGLDRPVRKTRFVGGKKQDVFKPLHEFISSHMARRTFVTMRMALGDPEGLIIQYTGHTSTETLQPYRGLINAEMIEEYKEAQAA